MSTFVRFRDGNKTNEEGAGKILAKLVGQAVVVGAETSCRIEEKGGGADDTLDAQIGEVIIIDDDGYGIGAWSDAIENIQVTANASGNPRIDVVVAYIDKAVADTVNNNSPDGLVFDIIEGTPAGAPTPPNDATIQAAVGADNPFIKLAQVAVADGFVSITDANITDLREQASFQSGGKKLQYDVANNIWTLEDSLEVESTLKTDTIAEKTAATGVTIDGLLVKDTTLQRFSEGDPDFVTSGGVWSADDLGNDLLASMTAIVTYINGIRIAVSAVAARAFTASKDTYVDLGVDGTIDYNEVANGATPPALAADHTRLAMVVTGASTTRIEDRRSVKPSSEWDILGSSELKEAASDTLVVDGLPARRFLKVLIFARDTGGSITLRLQFNGDTANNYSSRTASNGAADATETNAASIAMQGSSTSSSIAEMLINNDADEEKAGVGKVATTGAAGAASLSTRVEVAGKWVNTSDAISSITLRNTGAGSYAIGTKMVVLGRD